MKATARVIRGSVRAVAQGSGGLVAVAFVFHTGIRSKAEPMGGLPGMAAGMPTGIYPMARPTDESGLAHFLHVTPETPQQLVWLVPQYGIDYTIETSRGLKWQIK